MTECGLFKRFGGMLAVVFSLFYFLPSFPVIEQPLPVSLEVNVVGTGRPLNILSFF